MKLSRFDLELIKSTDPEVLERAGVSLETKEEEQEEEQEETRTQEYPRSIASNIAEVILEHVMKEGSYTCKHQVDLENVRRLAEERHIKIEEHTTREGHTRVSLNERGD